MTVEELIRRLQEFPGWMTVVLASSPDELTKRRTSCNVLDVYRCKDLGDRIVRLGHPKAKVGHHDIVLLEDEHERPKPNDQLRSPGSPDGNAK